MPSNAIYMELENTVFLITPVQFSVVRIIILFIQGSPKCGIVGGDKTEVEGEIGASREDPGACSPEKILKIYNT